ncbi:MAG: C40 family peptidase [Rhodothermaceae bacterium]|nr:C40 family peptidase [Rhodothermaceae bacterium]
MTSSLPTRVCIVLVTFLPALVMGCIYTQPTQSSVQESYVENTAPDSIASEIYVSKEEVADSLGRPDALEGENEAELSRKERLMIEADKWMGTPHRWGGTSRSGIDCSALVQEIYAKSFETRLPRTTKEQVRVGEKIRPSQLQLGDLVFYKINARTRHVGIYVGDNSFLHSSKSEGVAISSLDEPYWRSRYWTARRILPVDANREDPNIEQKKVQITW